jgi:hypothetical protein
MITQVLSKNGEEDLVKLLTGSTGEQTSQEVKHVAAAKLAQKQISIHKAAAAAAAPVKPGNSLKQTVVSADSQMQMSHTAQSYKEEEVMRSDAIEKKLLGEI